MLQFDKDLFYTFPFRTSEFSCQIGGCNQVFNTLESYEHHYNMLHRNVCSSCKRAFPSTHLLDVHILEWHDSLFQIMAEKQNMYQCLVESCPEKFKSSKDRKDHLITVHQYPSDFRFDKSLKTQRKEKMRPSSKESNVPMDMTVEDSEQSRVEAMEMDADESIMEKSRPLFVLGKGLPVCSKAGKRKAEYDNQEEFQQQKRALKLEQSSSFVY
ncbi:Zinc finger protein, partial [Ophiophagus hannah]